MNCKSYNHFFEVIANKTRLKIIDCLCESPKCVSELCSALNEEQSKISHNLKKLEQCHFIEVSKLGKKRVYSVNKKTILPLKKLVEAHVYSYCGKECGIRK